MYVVEILLAIAARAAHRSLLLCPKAVQSRLQLKASSPEGPTAPWVCRAAARMDSAVMLSKIAGWKLSLSATPKRASGCAGCGSGC